ncbi:MAG: hypothetical protein N2111_05640 [Candidatus Sumerlaeaceae bacterium]|nr:hypothetical protein [Candidatus Sumerlaeaceae bacterium]
MSWRLRRVWLCGIASLYAYQLVGKGIFPLRGVKTSLEFYNPPFFIYLISMPYGLSRLPSVAVGFLQLLQIGALAGLCWVLWRGRWRWGALVVAVFGALTPGPFWLMARLWGHAVIPVFSLLCFLCVYEMWRRSRCTWAALVLPPAIAAAQQCHFSGALLLPMAALALLLLRVRVAWRSLGAGVTLACAMYIPYIVHLRQTGFADARVIADLLAAKTGPGWNPVPMWRAAAYSFFDFGTNTALQQHFETLRQGLHFAYLSPILWIAVLRVFQVWRQFLRSNEPPPAGCDEAPSRCVGAFLLLAIIWCVVPLICFSVPRVELVPAYWLVALPGPWVLLASLAPADGRRSNHVPGQNALSVRWLRGVMTAAFAGLLVAAAVSSLVYHVRYVRLMRNPDPAVVVYPPYRDQRDAVWFICDHSRGLRVRLTQEDRTEAGGVDYQILYLIAAREGNALRFSPDSPAPPRIHYVLHNRSRPLPRVIATSRTPWERRRFGLLDVYWLDLEGIPSREPDPSHQPPQKSHG